MKRYAMVQEANGLWSMGEEPEGMWVHVNEAKTALSEERSRVLAILEEHRSKHEDCTVGAVIMLIAEEVRGAESSDKIAGEALDRFIAGLNHVNGLGGATRLQLKEMMAGLIDRERCRG